MCAVAESVKAGVESAGGAATIYQVAETLPQDVLEKMHAPAKPAYPVITPADLPQFDGFIFGVPTRYGNMPAQLKVRFALPRRRRPLRSRSACYWTVRSQTRAQAFWDATGSLWAQGALAGKYAAVFVSTGTPGGGQGTSLPSPSQKSSL